MVSLSSDLHSSADRPGAYSDLIPWRPPSHLTCQVQPDCCLEPVTRRETRCYTVPHELVGSSGCAAKRPVNLGYDAYSVANAVRT